MNVPLPVIIATSKPNVIIQSAHFNVIVLLGIRATANPVLMSTSVQEIYINAVSMDIASTCLPPMHALVEPASQEMVLFAAMLMSARLTIYVM